MRKPYMSFEPARIYTQEQIQVMGERMQILKEYLGIMRTLAFMEAEPSYQDDAWEKNLRTDADWCERYIMSAYDKHDARYFLKALNRKARDDIKAR